ncbi:DUF5666 domain-containing protein [Parasalinivibrio latis]|uniref:DUF5666 domain-containing protein n=1 Tax=Parasalinivibrio latis TaxID=2952610 RepID=UPI0030E19B2B
MKKLTYTSLLALALTGCGGSDGGSESKPSSSVNAAYGSISQLDESNQRITVNGQSFAVNSIQLGNNSLSFDELENNVTVKVKTATRFGAAVQVDPTLVGQVTSIDTESNTLVVNGIHLHFTNLSRHIQLNDWVMVSSLPTANAGYHVLSVVKLDTAPHAGEIEGLVANLTKSTFTIGATKINYANATIQEGLSLHNALWVEVDGFYEPTSREFRANYISRADLSDVTGDSEIEGVITWVANDYSSFDVNYRVRFAVNAATDFDDDGTKTDLRPGRLVEVESSQSGDTRMATEVEFEDWDFDDMDDAWDTLEFERTGIIEEFESGNTTTVLLKSGMSNIVLTLDRMTEIEDGPLHNLFGREVEVEGIKIGETFLAREIEASDD